jgi:hypothetical protein
MRITVEGELSSYNQREKRASSDETVLYDILREKEYREKRNVEKGDITNDHCGIGRASRI